MGKQTESPRRPAIEDHGLIGDLRTTALVAVDGTIDMFCAPDIDAPSVFAAVLDHAQGGDLGVDLIDLPDGADVRCRQSYLPNTNILHTRLMGDGAIVELRDFMVPTHLAGGRESVLVRQIAARHGSRSIRIRCRPGFDYARADHDVDLIDEQRTAVFRPKGRGGGALLVSCSQPWTVDGDRRRPTVTVEIGLAPDDLVTCVLQWQAAPPQKAADLAGTTEVLGLVGDWAEQTETYWHDWIDRSSPVGRWAEQVRRSALCLKLLQHSPTGGIVAAPTFGLPEWPGSARNWDYRYVWLRDAAFVVFALLRIGFRDEAADFVAWLARRCSDIDQGAGLRPVYRLDGSAPVPEETLDHLAGFEASTPVRVGNAAYEQVQLDVLGEVMDGLYLYDRVEAISWDLWETLQQQLAWLADHWRDPDSGLWESRGAPQQFVSSKVLVWVAFERAVRLSRRRGLPCDRDRWQREADEAYCWVQQNGWDSERASYVQRAGSADLDASALLIPMLRFASGTDPRVLATLDAVELELASNALLYRYRSAAMPAERGDGDGVGGPEGTFTVCSFWHVENLTRAGRLHEARLAFENVLTYANELGLFSEQIGPAGEALGNFPQALTHLALISAATTLDRALRAGLDR